MYIAHVFLFPILIGTLLALHLLLVAMRHHTQFRSRRATNRTVVGIPAFPGYAPRSLGLMFAVFGVLFLLGGLVQINPIWLWGPYHVGDVDERRAARLVPRLADRRAAARARLRRHDRRTTRSCRTRSGAACAFPVVVFGILFLWPWLERRFTHDYGFHNVLDRPRDAPWRTAFGAALLTWVFVIFVAGAADRIYVSFGIAYETLVWVFRVLALVAAARRARRHAPRLHRAAARRRGEGCGNGAGALALAARCP